MSNDTSGKQPAMSATLEILSVCTHNRTRSVLIGALLEAHLRAAGATSHIQSAGTAADGQQPIEHAIRLLAACGIDVDDHISRPIAASNVNVADLILTAEQQHVVAIAGQWPDAFARTFTLPELVERARSVGPRGDRSLAEWLRAIGVGRPTALDYLDASDIPEVADPTGKSRAVWESRSARSMRSPENWRRCWHESGRDHQAGQCCG